MKDISLGGKIFPLGETEEEVAVRVNTLSAMSIHNMLAQAFGLGAEWAQRRWAEVVETLTPERVLELTSGVCPRIQDLPWFAPALTEDMKQCPYCFFLPVIEEMTELGSLVTYKELQSE